MHKCRIPNTDITNLLQRTMIKKYRSELSTLTIITPLFEMHSRKLLNMQNLNLTKVNYSFCLKVMTCDFKYLHAILIMKRINSPHFEAYYSKKINGKHTKQQPTGYS
jgi:hypothetical protein